MRWLALWLACACGAAGAQEVARIDDLPLSAEDLNLTDAASRPAAAAALRQRAMKSALERFVAQHRLQASEEDLAAYAKWNDEFQRLEKERRARRLREVEAGLNQPGIAAAQREQFQRERDTLRKLAQLDGARAAASRDTAARKRVWGQWIVGFKANRALYEKYGGRLGLTKFGPEPIGALEALLREGEKAGHMRIFDAALAKEFWGWYAAQPRRVARPEEIDFTYYWTKPLPGSAQ